jgi:hypothetical protein
VKDTAWCFHLSKLENMMQMPIGSRILLISLYTFTSVHLCAQSCTVEKSIPAKHPKVGSGSATIGSDGITVIKGGQAVYVAIRNNNVLGVAYVLTIERDTKPPSAKCSYNALLPPRGGVILSNSLFAKTPLSWRVSVSVGDESDAGVLTYMVYSDAR